MRQRTLFWVYGHLCVEGHWKTKRHYATNRLYYIHEGKGGYEVAGVKYRFEPNKFYLLPNTLEIDMWSDETDGIVHTYCDFNMLPEIMAPMVFVGAVDDDAMLAHALDIFVSGGKEANEQRKFSQDFIPLSTEKERLYCGAVEYIVYRLIEKSKNHIVNDEAVTVAIEYMYDHISERISVEKLASVAYMSEGGFIKRFKKITGETPYSYLKKIRLDMAYYLREQGKTIEEIAELVGYSDGVALLHAIKNVKRQNKVKGK